MTDYHLPKYPKRKIPKVKRFETGKGTPSSNTLGFEIENRLARRRWPNSGRRTGARPYGWTCAPRPAASLLAAAEEEKSSGDVDDATALSLKLYFTHDDDPLSIPFSLFRISARDACYIRVIISATRKILAPHSLHNDYYYIIHL